MMTSSARNPRGTTASPFLRGLEKNATLISWLWRWHYSTNQVIAELLASSAAVARNLTARLEKVSLLRRVESDELQGANLWMLTTDGCSVAAELDDYLPAHYDTRPSTIDHRKVRHEISLQWFIARAQAQGKIHSPMPDRLLRANAEGYEKISDCLCTDTHGNRLSIEVERTEKTDRRLDLFLWGLLRQLQANEVHQVIVVTQIRGLVERYRATLSSPEGITRWRKDNTANKWVALDAARPASELTRRISFIHEPAINAPLHPYSLTHGGKRHTGGVS